MYISPGIDVVIVAVDWIVAATLLASIVVTGCVVAAGA